MNVKLKKLGEYFLHVNDVTKSRIISFVKQISGMMHIIKRGDHFCFLHDVFLGYKIDTLLSDFHSSSGTACDLNLICEQLKCMNLQ